MRDKLLPMLTAALALLISLSAPAPAQNERKQVALTEAELQTLWADLYGDDPAASTAVIKLHKHADATVPFLKEKLPPLKLDADECRDLLTKLGSEDEEVWKAAREKLDYFDPRLAIDLKTLMDEVKEKPARTRLVEVLSQSPADSLAGKDVTLLQAGDAFNFFNGRGSWWAEHRVERIGASSSNRKPAWLRVTRAVAILEQINTPEAVMALKRLALGNPDAPPTKAARESLRRLWK